MSVLNTVEIMTSAVRAVSAALYDKAGIEIEDVPSVQKTGQYNIGITIKTQGIFAVSLPFQSIINNKNFDNICLFYTNNAKLENYLSGLGVTTTSNDENKKNICSEFCVEILKKFGEEINKNVQIEISPGEPAVYAHEADEMFELKGVFSNYSMMFFVQKHNAFTIDFILRDI